MAAVRDGGIWNLCWVEKERKVVGNLQGREGEELSLGKGKWDKLSNRNSRMGSFSKEYDS